MSKKLLGIIVLVLLVALGAYYFLTKDSTEAPEENDEEEVIVEEQPVVEEGPAIASTTIGTSVNGVDIVAHRYGDGDKTVILVGAIHGGYEWNSALLAFDLADHFEAEVESIPEDISVVVIPVANPDGLEKVVGSSGRFDGADAPQFDFADEVSLEDTVVQGRFNANGVDLNRNFDCNWQSEAVWRENEISGGTEAFSEPESAALRDFILAEMPKAVVFYHSASRGVYTSYCGDADPLEETVAILGTYAEASGYPRFDEYPYYEVTGDVADWLSTEGVPAISVELTTHDVIEFEENIAGVNAIIDQLSEAKAMEEENEMMSNEVTFDVIGTNFAFDMSVIEVMEGDKVTINFESGEGYHDWVVDEFDAATDKVKEGEKTSVTFVADKAGEYEFYCSVGEHRAEGMIGQLVVEAKATMSGSDEPSIVE